MVLPSISTPEPEPTSGHGMGQCPYLHQRLHIPAILPLPLSVADVDFDGQEHETH